MSGTVTSTRDSMMNQSVYADQFGFKGSSIAPPPTRSFLPKRSAFSLSVSGLGSLPTDSVTSFRSGTSGASYYSATGSGLNQFLTDYDLLDPSRPDTGHEFDLYKHTVSSKLVHDSFLWSYSVSGVGTYHEYYSGPVGLFNLRMPTTNSIVDSNVWDIKIPGADPSVGTKAIAATSPTKPEAALGADILELKDGLPNFGGLALSKIRSLKELPSVASEEFLNWIFGLNPTVHDLNNVWQAMVNLRKTVNQLGRDSSRGIRRRWSAPETVATKGMFNIPVLATANSTAGSLRLFPYDASHKTTDRAGTDGNGTNLIDQLGGVGSAFGFSGASTFSVVSTTTTNTWFSGSFQYYLNTDSSLLGRLDRTGQRAQKLLGMDFDLHSIWEAMPWSWFVQWFVDIDQILRNMDSALEFNQLLRYGYLMQHTVVKTTVTTDGHVVNKINGRDYGNLTTTFVSERKQRIRATPFGFGVSTSSFSPTQWAILGALGFTKAPGVLW